MNFISLFSGIGGLDYGFTKANWNCVGWCELDKFAHKAYSILHDPKGLIKNEYDVRHIKEQFIEEIQKEHGTIDAIVAGFPCQAFSIAGKRQGFNDLTRGTLFFEIARIAQIAKPSNIILENVKGLCNHDRGRTFEIILSALDELGYDVEWQVLNSKNFGVPQNRERVFIVAYIRGSTRRKVFPITRENDATIEVVGMLNIKGNEQIRRVYNTDNLSPCLSTMQGGNREPKIAIPVLTPERLEKRQNGRRFKENGDPAFTLTALDRHGVLVVGNVNPSGNGMNGNVFNSIGLSPTLTTNKGEKNKILVSVNQYEAKEQENAHCLDANYYKGLLANQARTGVMQSYRIRKLTPLECFRLQSYPDEWYHTLKINGFSDTQLYKMAGNGVTSNVAFEIAKKLKELTNDTINNSANH